MSMQCPCFCHVSNLVVSVQARFSRPFAAGQLTLVLSRLDVPATSTLAVAAAASAAAAAVADAGENTTDEERNADEAAELVRELGTWRVCALQVQLHPDYHALRPLETWYDFPPFSHFDPTAASDTTQYFSSTPADAPADTGDDLGSSEESDDQ